MKLSEIRKRFRKVGGEIVDARKHLHKNRDKCFFCEGEEDFAKGYAQNGISFHCCPLPIAHSNYVNFCWICGYPKNIMAHHHGTDEFVGRNKPADFVLPMFYNKDCLPGYETWTKK